jgi:hypothetical protein
LGTRIIAEIRAGHVVADVFSGGANTNYEVLYEGKALDSFKSTLILPEVLDETKWFEGRHRYTDAEQRYIFVYVANPSSSGFYYNTNLVNSKEFKSYWDLVNPKWKGKYVSQDPLSTGLGASLQFYYYHPSSVPTISKSCLATCSRYSAVTGDRSPIGCAQGVMRSASVAGIQIEQKIRDCPSTSWTTSTGKKECSSLPVAVR